ncbi:MAG: 30S ribosomal protein S18 [Actinobacteria bacterium]|nr:MAG: 30S ribosomal protein S18 [Actinomycetota bacterium]
MSDYARKPRKKFCQYCKDKSEYVDYKDVQTLRRFMTDRGKIKPRRVTGNCTQHQHAMSVAIKRAREMALLPYAVPVISTKVEGKRGRG